MRPELRQSVSRSAADLALKRGLVHPMTMADTLSPEERSERMSRIRGRDTKPELWVRKELHGRGLRFRLHRKDLPGRPDLVLPKYGAVIFVHGCFWHAHSCQKGRIPGTRATFWSDKFDRNRKRDARNARALRAMGWRVFTLWECQLVRASTRETTINRIVKKIRDGA